MRGIRLFPVHNGSLEIAATNTVYCVTVGTFCFELSSQKVLLYSSICQGRGKYATFESWVVEPRAGHHRKGPDELSLVVFEPKLNPRGGARSSVQWV